MSNVIVVGKVSLTDINDAFSFDSPPQNLSKGNIWVDLSVNPIMLKRYNGSTWISIGELDPNLSVTITEINSTLGNMTNDNLIDFKERQVIKDRITDIIGFVIADTTTTLPTVAVLDRDIRGSFYTVRKSATSAGLATNNPSYVDVATKYNELKTYLDGLTPVKPWDLRSANKAINITVVKSTFRDRWLKFYTAVENLATATALKLKENVDNIDVGGENLTSNSTGLKGLTGWSTFQSANTLRVDPNGYNGKPAIAVNVTASAGAIRTPAIEIIGGKEYTISFYAKANKTTNISHLLKFKNSAGVESNPITTPTINNVSANQWVYVSDTFIAPDSAVSVSTTPRVTGTTSTYPITLWVSNLKLERGNIDTDWSSSHGDYQQDIDSILGKLVDVEFKITDSSIISTLTSSNKYLLDREADINTSKDYTDRNTGNLVFNPSLTGAIKGWTSPETTTIVKQDFFGTSTDVMRNINAHATTGAQVYSDYFEVDPSKMYEVSAWFKSSQPAGNIGSTYLGLNLLDKNGSAVGAEQISNSNGLMTNASNTNFYFWNTADTSSLTDWVKITGYILPTGFDEESAMSMSSTATSHARMKTNTHRARIRWLNYYNYGTSRTVWVANPRVVEISSEMSTSNKTEIIGSTLNSVVQAITPDGISTVIEESTFYQGYQNELERKANAEDLGDFVTKNELDEVSNRTEEILSDALAGIDFEPYATKLDLEEASSHITSKFSASNGMNLLNNSIGYGERNTTHNWGGTAWGTNVYPVANKDLDTLGFGSGFYFPPVASARNITQYVSVVPNVPYSLSWYINKSNASSGTTNRVYVSIMEGGTNKVSVNHDVITDGYENHTRTYTPTTNEIAIRVYAYAGAEATVTGLMLNIGDFSLPWSMATGEVYNTNVRTDITGIRVSQINNDGREIGYTHMTPNEFAGYYDSNEDGNFEKVFYIREDETVSKKFRALDEITMGEIKIISLKNSSNSGWAFVPVVP